MAVLNAGAVVGAFPSSFTYNLYFCRHAIVTTPQASVHVYSNKNNVPSRGNESQYIIIIIIIMVPR
jgi:hypothetical protein